jgi:flagellar motor switch protein FliN/FliY
MANDDKPAEDDGLADWAEALLEQKNAEPSVQWSPVGY